MKDILSILLKRGPGFLFSYFLNNVYFDIRYGVDTFRRKLPGEYDSTLVGLGHGIYYVGIRTKTLKKIFSFLKENINGYNKYQFVDLGSGKGKSVLYYILNVKNYDFLPIGIEYDNELHKIAISNFAKLNFTKKMKLICDDARNFLNYTDSNKLLIYLYNPFDWKILSEILEKIKTKKLECYICYIDPVEDVNIKNGYYLVHKIEGKYPGDNITFYKYSDNNITS